MKYEVEVRYSTIVEISDEQMLVARRQGHVVLEASYKGWIDIDYNDIHHVEEVD